MASTVQLSTSLPSRLTTESVQHAAKEAGEALQRERVIEWASAFQPARSPGHKTILQTPFDRAMAGRYFTHVTVNRR